MRARRIEAWSRYRGILTTGTSGVRGEVACLDKSSGQLKPATNETDLVPIGYFTEDVTGDGTIETEVELFAEIRIHWFDNDGTSPCAADDVGWDASFKDAHTVSMDATGRSVAGRVWKVSSTYGVAIQPRA